MTDSSPAITPANAGEGHRTVAERRVDLALIGLVAALPLLPTGPQYVGLTASWLPEASLAALAVVWLASKRAASTHAGRRAFPDDVRLVGRGFAAFLLVATGAMVLGLATENLIWSPEFRALLLDAPGRMIHPINQGADPVYPLRVWLTFVEGALAFGLVAAICSHASRPGERALTVLWAWLAGFAMVSSAAVIQYLSGANLQEHFARVNPGLFRSHATLDDPNTLGSFLVLGIGLVLGLALATPRGPDNRRRRLLLTTIGLIGTVGLVTTVSRAAWASLPLAVLVVGAWWPVDLAASGNGLRLRRWSRRALFAGATVVAMLLVARAVTTAEPGYRPATPWQAALATIDPRVPLTDVLKARDVTWAAALQMFSDKPLVGVGLGRYPRLLTAYREGLDPENAHSFLLQVLAEMGLAGFLALIVLIGSATLALLGRPGLVDRRSSGLAFGLAVGGLAFLLTSLTGHPLLTVSSQLLVGVLLAAGVFALQPTHDPTIATAAMEMPFSKRVFDVVMGTLLLIGLLPLLLVIAVAIKLDSPGPAVFVHWRIGMNRRRQQATPVSSDRRVDAAFGPQFRMLKFRTMHQDTAPSAPSPTTRDDPRVTPLGGFLRRTCLDELPQLWNVVLGDMSLVGPRPEMPEIVATYEHSHRTRLEMKPGITGLWQLRGPRTRHIHDSVRLDQLYIKRWSLGLDLSILLDTVRFIFRGQNH